MKGFRFPQAAHWVVTSISERALDPPWPIAHEFKISSKNAQREDKLNAACSFFLVRAERDAPSFFSLLSNPSGRKRIARGLILFVCVWESHGKIWIQYGGSPQWRLIKKTSGRRPSLSSRGGASFVFQPRGPTAFLRGRKLILSP